MGIQGLWPLIESTSTSIMLDALEGKRIAIGIIYVVIYFNTFG